MDKNLLLNSIKKVKETSPKRNFNQSIDLVINLKSIDIKNQEHKVDLFLTLPSSRGKLVKICGLVGNELAIQSRATFDKTILNDEFSKYGDKKILKKLASDFDFFVAQANLMAQIATVFGKELGPRGKMPNPKAGCVVYGTVQLMPLKEKLQRTVHLETKTEPTLKTSIGLETMSNEELLENAYHIYNSVIHLLPQEKHNIKSIILKTTMGPPVFITDKDPVLKIDETKITKSDRKNET